MLIDALLLFLICYLSVLLLLVGLKRVLPKPQKVLFWFNGEVTPEALRVIVSMKHSVIYLGGKETALLQCYVKHYLLEWWDGDLLSAYRYFDRVIVI